MNLRNLIWRELRERPSAMFTSTLAILLGVAALVAIRHITVFSEREVGGQLESLGANILVLPMETTLQDYYSADLSSRTLPESHVATILMENLPGVERLSPPSVCRDSGGESRCDFDRHLAPERVSEQGDLAIRVAIQ